MVDVLGNLHVMPALGPELVDGFESLALERVLLSDPTVRVELASAQRPVVRPHLGLESFLHVRYSPHFIHKTIPFSLLWFLHSLTKILLT